MKDRSTLYLACSALGLLALAVAPAPQAHDGDARAQSAVAQQQQLNSQRSRNDLVKIVKQVTEKYKSVAMAENDGYHLIFGCVSDEDSGAMGLHFVNLGLYAHADGTFDDVIDPYQPEIILYEPTPWGPKLTGADYIVDAETWNKTHGQAPELDGQIFHFFDAPNRFGLRPFYTLHVWAWKDNPLGTFTNWNPNVSCDGFNGATQ